MGFKWASQWGAESSCLCYVRAAGYHILLSPAIIAAASAFRIAGPSLLAVKLPFVAGEFGVENLKHQAECPHPKQLTNAIVMRIAAVGLCNYVTGE
jgi:hypothetical protein